MAVAAVYFGSFISGAAKAVSLTLIVAASSVAAGAVKTVEHALGRSDSTSSLRFLGLSFFALSFFLSDFLGGLKATSNHQSSELSQPVPDPVGS